jgi:hypothetical protein
VTIQGRKPKPDGHKVTRVPLTHGWLDVVDEPYRGPKPRLPKGLPPETRQWWRAVASMPHCSLWTETDWQFALDTALVHAAFIAGDLKQAGELRSRSKVLGMTLEARRDLRIRYVAAFPEDTSTVAVMSPDEEARWRRILDAD